MAIKSGLVREWQLEISTGFCSYISAIDKQDGGVHSNGNPMCRSRTGELIRIF